MEKTALITGCSSGVGRAAARLFRADGWTVYATARDGDALGDLEKLGVSTATMDVTSTDDVDRVVDRIIEERGGLDCLINNAGFAQMGPVADVSIDDVREQYEVNVFGPHRSIRACVPYMRERGAGTIINVTSITDRFPIAGSGIYSGSKSALATTTQALRQEVRGDGIDVVIVEPFLVATELYDRVRDELVDVEHGASYTDLYEVLELLHTVKSGGPWIVSPETVAATMLEAANSERPKRRYSVGWGAKVGAVVASLVPESWRTPILYAGVRTATTAPVRRILWWWFARNHRVDDSVDRTAVSSVRAAFSRGWKRRTAAGARGKLSTGADGISDEPGSSLEADFDSLEELFEYELGGVYDMETRLVEVLVDLSLRVEDDNLEKGFAVHRTETEGQVRRIERAFEALDVEPEARKNHVASGLLEEMTWLDTNVAGDERGSAYYLALAIRIERVEIVAYEELLAIADRIGLSDDVTAPLAANLEQEEKTLRKLEGLTGGPTSELLE